MANPLARVVMKTMVEKKGAKALNRKSTSSTTVNLGAKEDNLLKNIVNSSSQRSNTVEMLKTLNPSKTASNSSYHSKPLQNDRLEKTSKSGLSNMKSLESLSKGKIADTSHSEAPKSSSLEQYNAKPHYGKSSSSPKSSGVRAVSLESLVSGKTEEKTSITSNRVETTMDNRQQSGMMSLNQLAANKAKVTSSDKVVENEIDKAYVRSNVIGNLSAYVPKVTLDSIGKKGSLF